MRMAVGLDRVGDMSAICRRYAGIGLARLAFWVQK